MAVEEMAELPESGPLLRAAVAAMVLPRRPRPARAPETELLVRGVRVDRAHLTRYARVCGFGLTDVLPPTYPHVLAFGLSMSLMTRPDFPFPLAGLVHVQNTTEQRQPIGADQVLSLSVHAEAFREHDRGHAIDLVTTATVDETVAWHERSSYLRRSRVTREPDRTREHRETPTAAALWRVGRDAGTAYAKVSGDRNPIHTSRLGARLFGFPRPIAHGMWTLARCLAALGGRLPEAYTVDVQFKAPVLLPGTVAFTTGRDAAGRWRFGLHEPRSGKPHLTGTAG